MPNPTRPRLATESESRLAETEARTAGCYAEAEETTARMWEFARSIAGELEVADAVPIETNFEDTSSVHHLEDLRQRVNTRDIVPIKK